MAGHPGRVGAEQEIRQRWTMGAHYDVVYVQIFRRFDYLAVDRAIFNHYPGLHCLGYRLVGNSLQLFGGVILPLL